MNQWKREHLFYLICLSFRRFTISSNKYYAHNHLNCLQFKAYKSVSAQGAVRSMHISLWKTISSFALHFKYCLNTQTWKVTSNGFGCCCALSLITQFAWRENEFCFSCIFLKKKVIRVPMIRFHFCSFMETAFKQAKPSFACTSPYRGTHDMDLIRTN